MLNITADSTVWITAFAFRGKARRIINMADEGQVRIAICDPIAVDVLWILRYAFDWPPKALQAAAAQMSAIAHSVIQAPAAYSYREQRDADNRVIECGQAAESDVIVTLSKSLLRLRKFCSMPIVSPAAFLDIHARAKNGPIAMGFSA